MNLLVIFSLPPEWNQKTLESSLSSDSWGQSWSAPQATFACHVDQPREPDSPGPRLHFIWTTSDSFVVTPFNDIYLFHRDFILPLKNSVIFVFVKNSLSIWQISSQFTLPLANSWRKWFCFFLNCARNRSHFYASQPPCHRLVPIHISM